MSSEAMHYDACCAGKEAYPSVSSALAAKKMRLRLRDVPKNFAAVQPYECDCCRQVHLGHCRARRRNRRERKAA